MLAGLLLIIIGIIVSVFMIAYRTTPTPDDIRMQINTILKKVF